MKTSALRARLKEDIPGPVRWVLRGFLHYYQRQQRWWMVLWQIRGFSTKDQVKLVASALWGVIDSLWALQQWRGPAPLFDMHVNVPGVGLFKVRARTDDLWHVLPFREKAIFKALDRYLKPGANFVDAGANIGVYTIYASYLMDGEGQVIAIEMMPETVDILKNHVALNGCSNVIVHQRALSDKEGGVVRATVLGGNHGQASIARNTDNKLIKSCDVMTSTMDKLLSDIEYIDVIKIDIEGAEALALSGARETLSRVGVVIYESNSYDIAENEEIDNLMLSYGFYIEALDGNNRMAIKN